MVTAARLPAGGKRKKEEEEDERKGSVTLASSLKIKTTGLKASRQATSFFVVVLLQSPDPCRFQDW